MTNGSQVAGRRLRALRGRRRWVEMSAGNGSKHMHSEILKYHAIGRDMESHLYFDPGKSGKRPGILVFPEAFGLSDHTKEKARKLAELGYVTLANDLFGEGKTVTSMDEVMG